MLGGKRATVSHEIEYSELVQRFLGLSAEDLISYNVKYHRNCYKNLTNKANLEAAKKRYDRGKTSGRLSDITQKKWDGGPLRQHQRCQAHQLKIRELGESPQLHITTCCVHFVKTTKKVMLSMKLC